MDTIFWRGRRVLVTGCLGFIGAHVTRALVNQGAEVTGLDKNPLGTSPTWRALDLSGRVDVRARSIEDGVASAIADAAASIVFHLAGMVSVHGCARDPHGALRDNVLATSGLLEAVRRTAAVEAAIFASSDRVYGRRRTQVVVPWFEHHALEPVDVYGATKAAADILVTQAARAGRPVATLRHVNAFGEADPHLDHLIPGTIRTILQGGAPEIRSDGSPQKAYLHVDDVVRAYLFLARRTAEGHTRGAYNCAPHGILSVRKVVDLIAEQADYHGPVKTLGTDLSQQGYIEHLSSAKLRYAGWSDQVSLVTGITRTLEWFRAHPEWWA